MAHTAFLSDNKDGAWSVRKRPQQRRARDTVESIFTAAERIIRKDGYRSASTNHIAEVAGVSVGSLYQYFPNKEAIVAGLIEKSVSETAEEIRLVLYECMNLPLEISTPRLIAAILNARKKNAFAFIQLPREAPLCAASMDSRSTEKFLYTTIYAYYVQHRASVVVEDLATAIFVTEHMVVGSIDAYLAQEAPGISEEELVNHLSKAVVNYLTK